MRKRFASILAGAGLLTIAGTAAADPTGFGFNISFGAPQPVYQPAPTYYYPQPVYEPAPVRHHVREEHRWRRSYAHAGGHARFDDPPAHRSRERGRH